MSLVRSLAALAAALMSGLNAFAVSQPVIEVGCHAWAWPGPPSGLELPLSSDTAGIGVAVKRLSTGSRSRNADGTTTVVRRPDERVGAKIFAGQEEKLG